MPQIVTSQDFSAPILPSQVKPTVFDHIVESLLVHGYVVLPSGICNAETPWQSVSNIMEKLDMDVINKINSVYNDKKIIKSSSAFDDNIDKKTAFDLCPERLTSLTKNGLMEIFPEMPGVLGYFSDTSNWLKAVLGGLGNFDNISSVNFNFRMIEYEGVAGTCLPHRDFGLLTLVQSTTSGLLIEKEGKMVPVDGDVILAGWCLHLLTNGRIPAPLHQVSGPPVKRYSCVTFMAPLKDYVLDPHPLRNMGNLKRVYRTVVTSDLKEMMAKRWRRREGTLTLTQEEAYEANTSQDDLVERLKI